MALGTHKGTDSGNEKRCIEKRLRLRMTDKEWRMEVKVCSPGVGCVAKAQSLCAAGCEEGAVTGQRRGERRV